MSIFIVSADIVSFMSSYFQYSCLRSDGIGIVDPSLEIYLGGAVLKPPLLPQFYKELATFKEGLYITVGSIEKF
jgi:hypothetical protein